MTRLASPSPEELSERRRTLKKQRRIRNLQHIWRILAISGLAASAVWLIRNPFWLLLQSPGQVLIEGNEMLSEQAVHELLELEYPQRIFDIEPEQVVQQLRTQSPIAYARVSRQLFPPRLEVTLKERMPVAVTVPSRPDSSAAGEPTPITQAGLLDSAGYWMAQSDAAGLNTDFKLPTLKVRGFHPRYASQWPLLYEAVQGSAVEIQEIDLRSPNNLILQTAVGAVHLGVYDPRRLVEQLAILPQLEPLTNDPGAPAVDYIDLANPQVPAVKLSQPPPATETP